ncbi:MAG TPA: S41 family peptidase [Bryobacteraceae bacterium]|nr:S41 family peptidase [Bryobacteraceae bacterium]
MAIRIFKLLSLMSAWVVVAFTQGSPADLSMEQRAWVASKLYASVQMFNAHGEGSPDFDLDREYKAFLGAALSAADRRGFDLAAMKFVGGLRNGHSSFSDEWLFRQYGQPLGFTLQPMAEGWVVTSSQIPELNPGDIVANVDDKSIDAFYAEHDGLLEGSSEATRRRRFASQSYLWPEKFVLSLKNGKQVQIDRREQKLGSIKSFPFPQGEVETPAGVAFVRIQSFGDLERETALVKRIGELSAARAIVIDVRGNGGGSTPTRLIAALMNRPWRGFVTTTPIHVALTGAQSQARKLFPAVNANAYYRGYFDAHDEMTPAELRMIGTRQVPLAGAYSGKVVLLADGYCNSACEDFLVPFKTSGRGILVGETTNGSSGQPYYYDFGNGMAFRVSTKRYYMPDGSVFEGVGIKPDVEVRPSVDDWRAGRDPVLVKALEVAAAR